MPPIVSMSILFRFSLLTCSSSFISLIPGSPLALPYPTFRFKVVPVVFIGSGNFSLFSLIFICWQKMESLFGRSMQWEFYQIQTWVKELSNSASERRTVTILRRPPLTGMTTNDSWAWTMSPLRNVWGSHCWNLKFKLQCEFKLEYLPVKFSHTLYRHFCPCSLRSIEPRCLRYAHTSKFHPQSPFHAVCCEGQHPFGDLLAFRILCQSQIMVRDLEAWKTEGFFLRARPAIQDAFRELTVKASIDLIRGFQRAHECGRAKTCQNDALTEIPKSVSRYSVIFFWELCCVTKVLLTSAFPAKGANPLRQGFLGW